MAKNGYKVVRNVLKVLGRRLVDDLGEDFEAGCRELFESEAQNLGYASSICVVMAAKIFFETRRSDRRLRIRGRKSVLKIFKLCGFDSDERVELEATD